MRILKKIGKWLGIILLIPIVYVFVALIISSITVERLEAQKNYDQVIYLNTNGVHLDIVIPIEYVSEALRSGLGLHPTIKYVSFGWGDENFYINTPTWGDLTISNALGALFVKSPTLVHIDRYKRDRESWVKIEVNQEELQKLNTYIQNTFDTSETGTKILLEGKGYSNTDAFYKAKGSYSCFKTCNTWVNSGFKESGLEASYWTPFDFGLLSRYE